MTTKKLKLDEEAISEIQVADTEEEDEEGGGGGGGGEGEGEVGEE